MKRIRALSSICILFCFVMLIQAKVSFAQVIAGGQDHSLVLCDGGTVWASGLNINGLLGDGTEIQRTTPVQTIGLSDIVEVAAGTTHSMALRNDGTVWAWGANVSGSLGNGSTIPSLVPKQVHGPGGVGFLEDITAIAVGLSYSMALRNDGTVWAWGYNGTWQLGAGTLLFSATPVQVLGLNGIDFLDNVTAIAIEHNHSMALRNNGTVVAWGRNYYGQLGNGTLVSSIYPVPVVGLTNIIDISVGSLNSVALQDNGTVWVWGFGGDGQMGNGITQFFNPFPIIVPGLSNIIDIEAGRGFNLALQDNGPLWGWGQNNFGQLSTGVAGAPELTPVQALGLTDPVALGSGSWHSLVVQNDGTVMGSGRNARGALGNGSTATRVTLPVQRILACTVTPISTCPAVLISSIVPLNESCLGDCNGGVDLTLTGGTPPYNFAWSNGETTEDISAQCTGVYTVNVTDDNGCTDMGSATVSVAIPTSINGIAVEASWANFVIEPDNTVWGWGWNGGGAIGDGTLITRPSPVKIPGLNNIIDISSGENHSLAIESTSGTVWAWGANYAGQLGNGTTTRSLTPIQVSGLTDIIAVKAGIKYSLALGADGRLWAWGDNSRGQLGDGTLVGQLTPKPIMSNVVDIAVSTSGLGWNQSSYAVKDNGTVRAWGNNNYGQLGDGSVNFFKATPVIVNGLTGVVAIEAGLHFALALNSNGEVWGWGQNVRGQLGDGTLISKSTPVMVLGLPAITSLGAGSAHGLAIDGNNNLWGWGDNGRGQLGIGTNSSSEAPIKAIGITNAIDADGGWKHTVILTSTGGVKTVGNDSWEQLGNGALGSSNLYTIDVTPSCPVDDDGDGITNDVDLLPNVFSNNFDDGPLGGTTAGTITDRGDRTFQIFEEQNPDGVHIMVSDGSLPAEIQSTGCVPPVTITVPANVPANFLFTCSSASFEVFYGSLEVTAEEGDLSVTAFIDTSNSVTITSVPDTIFITTDSTMTILVNGVFSELPAGQSIAIYQLSPLIIANGSTSICEGDNVILDGGAGFISYLWSTGETTQTIAVSQSGSFSVFVQDPIGREGMSDTVIVTENANPSVDAGQCETVYLGYSPKECADIASNTSSGTTPYTYLWSTTETTQNITVCPGSTNIFSVTVTDVNGCTGEDDVTVNVVDVRCGNNLNKVQLCHIPPGNPGNAQSLCLASGAIASHLLNHGDIIGVCGAIDPCFQPKLAFLDEEGHAEFEKDLEVDWVEKIIFEVYPNPSSETAKIRYTLPEYEKVTIALYNLSGEQIALLYDGYAEANKVHEVDFETRTLANGLYYYRLLRKSTTHTKKLVILKRN